MSATSRKHDPFGARDTFNTGSGQAGIYRLSKLEERGLGKIAELPFSIRLLLEAALRTCDGYEVTEADVEALAHWATTSKQDVEIPFKPARVVLQDFTGVPCVVDLAAMRGAMRRLGGDPKKINPLIPVDLVIDHSVQVDHFGEQSSLDLNIDLEFSRNQERYEFLRWGQKAFNNFRVVPPAVGIVHQVNLEFLAKCVFLRQDAKGDVAVPDTLVGTDSHTTMINGLGVLGWGVGGIEAEAVMLGQPLYMLLPEVVGFELTGQLPPGTTATDLVLTVTQILRKAGVVGKFVEFFGSGVSNMKLADRATIGNMAPEYGATMGFFPVDDETLRYLRMTGRSDAEVQLVERYTKEQGLFRTDSTPTPKFSQTLSLDLSTIEPSLAGPKRPQDRVPLASMQESFRKSLRAPIAERGFALGDADLARKATVANNGSSSEIGHGAVVIAAVLIVQCFLFGDGGVTALGANFVNMGLIGSIGNDTMSGGDGDDQIVGDAGNDVLSGDAGEDFLQLATGGGIAREVDQAGAVLALRGQVQAGGLLGDLGKKLVGQLQENARAVTGVDLGAAGAAMVEVLQHLQTLLEDLVGAATFHVHHETNAAGVVLKPGIVEALLGGPAGEVIRIGHGKGS